MRIAKKVLSACMVMLMSLSCVFVSGCARDTANISGTEISPIETVSRPTSEENKAIYYPDDVIAPTNLPAIHITLDDNLLIGRVTKEAYVSAKISVVGSEEHTDIIDAHGSIKGRGNFSWEAPKKPYNIKFQGKIDLLGMGEAKKWVLTANYWDKTMLRNYITLMLAKEMGIRYAVDVQFIDLYINGVYQGNYLLSEKVEIGKERINIDDANGGVLLEIEQPYRHGDGAECDLCFETGSGVHLKYTEPEADDITAEQLRQLMSATNAFLAKMDASLYGGYDAYSQYIDVDSFVDWYILNEFCKNYDSQFVTSCYCYYDPADGKLHMGPPWDYDTCYGNQNPRSYGYPEDFFVKEGAAWYKTLMRDATFENLVKTRWTELKKQGVIGNVLNNAVSGAALIDASKEMNFKVWPNMLKETELRGESRRLCFTNYKSELDYLKQFIAKRTVWLDEQWNTDYDSSANQVDNVNILAKGVLMDNDVQTGRMDKVKIRMTYEELTDQEKSQLDAEVRAYFAE